MRLRTRIILGYWYLVTLLFISAAGAAVGLLRLSSNIGLVLAENYDSIHASMAMTESLERQDSAVLAVLLGKTEARAQLQSSESAFRSAITRARANITIQEEDAVISDIEQRFAAFAAARDELLDEPRDRPLLAYEEGTFPLFEAVKSRVLDLLELNYKAMVEADQRAQRSAVLQATTLALLVVVALASLAVLSRAMNRTILVRLDELADVAEAISGGDLDRRALADGQDELGSVARQLNVVLDRLQEERSAAEGRVSVYRELVAALTDSLPKPAAIVDLAGQVVASTFGDDASDLLTEIREQLPRSHAVEPGHEPTIRLASGSIRLSLLRAASDKPVAWLVVPLK